MSKPELLFINYYIFRFEANDKHLRQGYDKCYFSIKKDLCYHPYDHELFQLNLFCGNVGENVFIHLFPAFLNI